MLTIRILVPSEYLKLARLFESLSTDSKWFHPHPMTLDEAMKICSRKTKDVYAGVFIDTSSVGTALVAYGMLRGWDDGWDIPSLGIAVHPEYRGKRIARTFMEYLHCTAVLRGAKKVRISVDLNNVRARYLYASMGYVFEPGEDRQLVGFFTPT